METKSVTLDELSEPVRSFLAAAGRQNGLMVRDGEGRMCFSVVPCREPTSEEREKALRVVRQIQENVEERMRRDNRTEAELDRILLEDD